MHAVIAAMLRLTSIADAQAVVGCAPSQIMFSPHRDYLLAVARDLEVAEVIKPEVEMDVRACALGAPRPSRAAD